MNTDNKITIVVAIVSLIISIITIILTSPIIINIYSKPNLYAFETNRELDGDTFRTIFILKNDGPSSAKNIEFILNTHDDDLVQVLQGFTGETVEKENGPSFKTVILKTSNLPPNDQIIIIVTGSKKSLVIDSEGYNIKDNTPLDFAIPFIVSARSERVLADITKLGPWLIK